MDYYAALTRTQRSYRHTWYVYCGLYVPVERSLYTEVNITLDSPNLTQETVLARHTPLSETARTRGIG
jgi:hypothetical protein